jgi:hypothetical protein
MLMVTTEDMMVLQLAVGIAVGVGVLWLLLRIARGVDRLAGGVWETSRAIDRLRKQQGGEESGDSGR